MDQILNRPYLSFHPLNPMTSTLLESPLKLPKAAKGAFLAAGIAIAGSAVLSAGYAQAITVGDYSVVGFEVNGNGINSSAPGTVEVKPGLDPGVVTVEATFEPLFRSADPLDVQQYGFTITAPKGQWFSSVALDSIRITNGTFVTKYISWDGGDKLLKGKNGNGSDFFLPGKVTSLTILDTYVTDASGSLERISNTFTSVPGPLPILGVAAAFGYSRKLRKRINNSRLQYTSV